MKRRYLSASFLLLTLLLAAVTGCRTPAAPQTVVAPLPGPTVDPYPGPTAYPPPQPSVAPSVGPTVAPSPGPTQVTVEPQPTLTELRTFPRVTVEQVKQWMDAGEPLFLIDARSAEAWSSATTKAPGALRVPPHEDIEPYLAEIPKDRKVVIYCT